jgi:hypothetical protein
MGTVEAEHLVSSLPAAMRLTVASERRWIGRGTRFSSSSSRSVSILRRSHGDASFTARRWLNVNECDDEPSQGKVVNRVLHFIRMHTTTSVAPAGKEAMSCLDRFIQFRSKDSSCRAVSV